MCEDGVVRVERGGDSVKGGGGDGWGDELGWSETMKVTKRRNYNASRNRTR